MGSKRPLEIKAVLFDLGNTLAGGSDTYEAFKASILAVASKLRELGFRVDAKRLAEVRLRNRAFFTELRKKTLKEVLGEIWMRRDLEDAGLKPDDSLVKEALRAHCEAIVNLRYVYDDVLEALEKLMELGYRMAVVSNVSVHWMAEETLRRLGLMHFFEFLVTSASVGWRKPHPAIFDEALRLLGLTSKEAVFVGDDLWADIYGAKSIGMRTVWIKRKEKVQEPIINPDAEVNSLKELMEVILSFSE